MRENFRVRERLSFEQSFKMEIEQGAYFNQFLSLGPDDHTSRNPFNYYRVNPTNSTNSQFTSFSYPEGNFSLNLGISQQEVKFGQTSSIKPQQHYNHFYGPEGSSSQISLSFPSRDSAYKPRFLPGSRPSFEHGLNSRGGTNQNIVESVVNSGVLQNILNFTERSEQSSRYENTEDRKNFSFYTPRK